MLKLDKLTRRFGDNLAVNNANLTIPDGQMVGIIGRSGAGKSTLLRLLNRLIDPSEGQILFGDTISRNSRARSCAPGGPTAR
jgi:phosphonate transport system ATP-binding protein